MSRNAASFLGKTVTVGKYTVQIKDKIGEGGYAWVYRAVDQQGNDYALKYVNCLTPERYDQFKKEAIILKQIPEHEHIVKLYDASFDQNRYIINFLFEYCPQTAIGILSKRTMTKEEILIFFEAICSATAFLHSQQTPIIHRDLKPENLLVSQQGIPKLCDFGSATTKVYKITKPEEIGAASDDIERNTTQNYRAPEMVDLYKRVPVGTPADVWALGCTLFKLVTRDDIYKPDDRLPILQGRLTNIPAAMDKDFANLIRMCIQVDPNRRPTAARLAEIALMLRGDKKTIALPPKKVSTTQVNQPSAASESSQQGGWGWLKSVQETYRSVVTQGAEGWAVKATFADDQPPNSKYVRRILVGAVRHTDVDAVSLTDFLLSKRPWQTDARIAAKSLYLVLLMAQYGANVKPLLPATVKADTMIAHFSQGRADEHPAGSLAVINGIGSILRLKLMFHGAHPEFEGNLACQTAPSDGAAEDALKYAAQVATAAQALVDSAKQARDFAAIVMCQPAVDEALAVLRLISQLRPAGFEETAAKLNALLEAAKSLPYLTSAIDYPADASKLEPPHPRFTASK